MKLHFVNGARGNYHMTEILSALCAAVRDSGHDAVLDSSGFPPASPDTVYVVIPHEFYGLESPTIWPSQEQRGRTIALCVENPWTEWFESTSALAPHFAAVLAINHSSLTELRRRGVSAEHLQLGYLPQWDAWYGADVPRPIDVTYLGSAEGRRDALVAGYGRWLWHRRTSMLVPPQAPKPSARRDYLVEEVKYTHLSRCKVLVNLHRHGSHSFEWTRALQAMANGCVVVSEPSVDHHPLIPGEHFVVADARSIAHVVNGLLDEPERLDAIRAAAYKLIRRELNMHAAVERLLVTADDLLAGGATHDLPPVGPPAPDPAGPGSANDSGDDPRRLGFAVRKLTTDVLDLRRRVDRLLEQGEGRDPDADAELVTQTDAYEGARPRVSVAITLYNYEREVLDALGSVVASEYEDYEVLVLDDASSDASLAAVVQFAEEHPWLPMIVMRHRVNKGLGMSRNALARTARGEFMFVLDADNLIYPTALGRLVEGLEQDPRASFSYPIIAVTSGEEPVYLTSKHAWDPQQFRHGNYIDAMALLRLDDLLAIGGYTEDIRLTGWEDFHLWCRCAESGRRGRLVPEVLASYRKAEHSMLAWVHSDITAAWSLMHRRFPSLIPSVLPG